MTKAASLGTLSLHPLPPWWKKQKAHYFAMDQTETLHYEHERSADENSPVLDQPVQSR